MKDLSLLALITQLALGVAVPLAGLIVLAVWLRSRFGLGDWVVLVGALLGLVMAIDSFVHTLKAMVRISKDKKKDEPPTVSFHDHD